MAKIRVSYEYSEAEDKSIRLGLFLIICGVLSLFILGFCWLNPTLQNLQCKTANCTVLSVQQNGEMFECTFTCGTDCKGTSLYPCLQIYVNNSESNSRALLHYDEQQLLLNPKNDPGISRDLCRALYIMRPSQCQLVRVPCFRLCTPTLKSASPISTHYLRGCALDVKLQRSGELGSAFCEMK
ncbi:KCMB4 protein, partial [Polypterus senegalus]|nr:KCMB4 protein [Polypterus senegalus]